MEPVTVYASREVRGAQAAGSRANNSEFPGTVAGLLAALTCQQGYELFERDGELYVKTAD